MQRTGTAVALWLLLLTSTGTATADEFSVTAKQLTGTSGRIWTKTKITRYLGKSGGCHSGETWSFRADGVLTRKKCLGGQFSSTIGSWSLSSSSGDEILIIDGVAYDPRIARKAGRLELMLTNRGTSKLIGSEEIVLSSGQVP